MSLDIVFILSYLWIVSILGDVFEHVQERVGVLRPLRVQLGRLQDGCCNAGIAQNGEQGVAVDHVVVLGVSEGNKIFFEKSWIKESRKVMALLYFRGTDIYFPQFGGFLYMSFGI